MGMTRTEALVALVAHFKGEGPEVRLYMDGEYFKCRLHETLGPQWFSGNIWDMDDLRFGEYSLTPPAPRTFLGVWEEVPSFDDADPAGSRVIKGEEVPMATRCNGKQLDYALLTEPATPDGPWFWVRRISVNPPSLSELRASRPDRNVLLENLKLCGEPGIFKDFKAVEPPEGTSLIKHSLEDKKLFLARVAPGYEQCVKRFALTRGNFTYGLSGWASSDRWDLGWFKEGNLTGKRYIWLRKTLETPAQLIARLAPGYEPCTKEQARTPHGWRAIFTNHDGVWIHSDHACGNGSDGGNHYIWLRKRKAAE